MKINNEEDILRFIREDFWMMDILKTVKQLNLPDWWICAGFVRSKIWDVQHGFQIRTPLPDIDVIYFDSGNLDEAAEKRLEEKLFCLAPHLPWSVKNQARMHSKNQVPPYTSSADGIAHFPETVTALGVTLDEQSQVLLTAPWGIHDVIYLEVHPSPPYVHDARLIKIYQARLEKKRWNETWGMVKIHSGCGS